MTRPLPGYFITDPDILPAYAEDVSGEIMIPQYLVRPQSVEEIAECLRYCNAERIAVTPAGRRTSDTAAALSNQGVCLSTEKMRAILQVNPDERFAIVEPGILLGDLKRELAAQGLYYPPDPSSENTASLGGTVATNAAGPRSYKYGATLRHILGLEVVLADGSVHTVANPLTDKSTTGPCALTNMGDVWVGSEGILGVVSKVKVALSRGVPAAFAIVAFFDRMEDLFQLAIDLRDGRYPHVTPRVLEFMDESCLMLLRDAMKFPQVPANGCAAAIIEQEYEAGRQDNYLSEWLSVLERAKANVSDSIVADSDSKIVELRELRHYVPSTLNEHGNRARTGGGRKVSTDWSVSVHKIPQMFREAEKLCLEHGFAAEHTYRYAHLGNGHPHFNFVAESTAQLQRCLLLREKLSQLAVSLGGTVAAEHGIGKLRKKLFAFEKPELKLRILAALKRELDPNGIMAPGNII